MRCITDAVAIQVVAHIAIPIVAGHHVLHQITVRAQIEGIPEERVIVELRIQRIGEQPQCPSVISEFIALRLDPVTSIDHEASGVVRKEVLRDDTIVDLFQ